MRQGLARFYRQTCVWTAHFQTYGRTADGSNVICVANVRLDGQIVADHVWIHRSKHMKRLNLRLGDVVTFEAQVGRYPRTKTFTHVSEIEYDFNLEKVRDFQVVRRVKEQS